MIYKTLSKAKNWVGNYRDRRFYESIYSRYSNYTMIKIHDYIANLRLADNHRGVKGCVVECGTWRGGMIAGIADMLGSSRSYFLFDSFEGLPEAVEIDGLAALAWQKDKDGPNYFDNCTASAETAAKAMSLSGAKQYQLIKGWFRNTLPSFVPPEPIALLRLDADWYDSTMACLENLHPHMAPDGIILVDDYYTWDGCSKAVHSFLAKEVSPARITQAHGVCVIKNFVPTRADSARDQP